MPRQRGQNGPQPQDGRPQRRVQNIRQEYFDAGGRPSYGSKELPYEKPPRAPSPRQDRWDGKQHGPSAIHKHEKKTSYFEANRAKDYRDGHNAGQSFREEQERQNRVVGGGYRSEVVPNRGPDPIVSINGLSYREAQGRDPRKYQSEEWEEAEVEEDRYPHDNWSEPADYKEDDPYIEDYEKHGSRRGNFRLRLKEGQEANRSSGGSSSGSGRAPQRNTTSSRVRFEDDPIEDKYPPSWHHLDREAGGEQQGGRILDEAKRFLDADEATSPSSQRQRNRNDRHRSGSRGQMDPQELEPEQEGAYAPHRHEHDVRPSPKPPKPSRKGRHASDGVPHPGEGEPGARSGSAGEPSEDGHLSRGFQSWRSGPSLTKASVASLTVVCVLWGRLQRSLALAQWKSLLFGRPAAGLKEASGEHEAAPVLDGALKESVMGALESRRLQVIDLTKDKASLEDENRALHEENAELLDENDALRERVDRLVDLEPLRDENAQLRRRIDELIADKANTLADQAAAVAQTDATAISHANTSPTDKKRSEQLAKEDAAVNTAGREKGGGSFDPLDGAGMPPPLASIYEDLRILEDSRPLSPPVEAAAQATEQGGKGSTEHLRGISTVSAATVQAGLRGKATRREVKKAIQNERHAAAAVIQGSFQMLESKDYIEVMHQASQIENRETEKARAARDRAKATNVTGIESRQANEEPQEKSLPPKVNKAKAARDRVKAAKGAQGQD